VHKDMRWGVKVAITIGITFVLIGSYVISIKIFTLMHRDAPLREAESVISRQYSKLNIKTTDMSSRFASFPSHVRFTLQQGKEVEAWVGETTFVQEMRGRSTAYWVLSREGGDEIVGVLHNTETAARFHFNEYYQAARARNGKIE
jgi:hypothetical protein